MTSYELEVISKNAIINEVKKEYGEELKIEELHLVWFTKALQNFKCVVVDLRPDNQRLYECTYNGNKQELYVDIYEKKVNRKICKEDFNKVAKR
jgi:hypothetical protein